jgi:hypothetical protein
MLYLSRVDVNTGLIVAITRVFSSSIMHGSSTALVGIAIGGFPMGRINHPLLAWIVGLAIAISYHLGYNRAAYHDFGPLGLFILVGAAFTGLLLVAGAILWGLRRERRRMRRSLGMSAGVSKGEANLIQRIEDLDALLVPVETRFGEGKRQQVANVLILAAQLAMKQSQMKSTKDPELRAELAAEVTEAKRELRRQRHEVGMYVMSYVRSIVPKTTWSLWARLEQTLSKREASRTSMWSLLESQLPQPAAPGESMYARIDAARGARAQVS